eukprot:5693670-Amphidinium_carterae.1
MVLAVVPLQDLSRFHGLTSWLWGLSELMVALALLLCVRWRLLEGFGKDGIVGVPHPDIRSLGLICGAGVHKGCAVKLFHFFGSRVLLRLE